MGCDQSICEFTCDLYCSRDLQRAALDLSVERVALQQLHCDERPAVVLSDRVDGANVGMIERAGCTRFPLQTIESGRIIAEV